MKNEPLQLIVCDDVIEYIHDALFTTKQRYCSFCGNIMNVEVIGAEKYEAYYECGPMQIYSKFNKETGKRNLCLSYRCPNSRKWFNPHDDYIVDELIPMKDIK